MQSYNFRKKGSEIRDFVIDGNFGTTDAPQILELEPVKQ